MPMFQPFTRGLAFAALAAFALGACADSAGGSGGTETETDSGMLPDDPGPGGAGGEGGGGAGGGGPGPADAWELQIVGDANLLVFTGETTRLTVKLVGGADMSPVPNQRVSLEQQDQNGQPAPQGVEGSGLRGFNANTAADGSASFEFIAGPRPATLRVQASAGDAPPVRWTINVAEEGTGGISVTVNYDTGANRYRYADLQRAQVDLFRAQDADCATLRQSAANLAGAWLTLPEISPFNEVDNQTSTGNLDAGAEFNVAAVARGANGNAVAFGCAEGVTIEGGRIVEATVDLADLPLEYKGRYTAVHRFDLSGMLRGSGDATLERVADTLDILRVLGNGEGDRGRELTRLVCEVANFDQGICDIVSRLGGRIVNEVFEEILPQVVLDILTLLGDLATIITDLTVIGEIELTASHPDASGRLAGNDDRWQKYRFRWQGETRDFTIGDLDVDRRPVFGTFGAQLQGADLIIEAHSLTVRYGLIALGLLEQWLFPRLTGGNQPVGLEELLAAVVPCRQVNDFFGDPNSGICEDVLVAALSDIILEQIGRLDFDADQFVIDGVVTPLDEDGDLVIDKLDAGRWNGRLTVGGGVYQFQGCFNACRGMECPEACRIGQ